jgi:hypothetical protein
MVVVVIGAALPNEGLCFATSASETVTLFDLVFASPMSETVTLVEPDETDDVDPREGVPKDRSSKNWSDRMVRTWDGVGATGLLRTTSVNGGTVTVADIFQSSRNNGLVLLQISQSTRALQQHCVDVLFKQGGLSLSNTLEPTPYEEPAAESAAPPKSSR